MFSRSRSRSSIFWMTSSMAGVGLRSDSACFRSSAARLCCANGLSSSASECRDACKDKAVRRVPEKDRFARPNI
jgi:hypothetical protein